MSKPSFALLLAGVIVLANGCTSVRQTDATKNAALPGTQTPQHFEKQITRTDRLDYLLFLPEGYSADPAKKWPVMLFLHGAGERGTDIDKVTVHGPPKLVKAKKDFPFVLVSPQCPEGDVWHDDQLVELLSSVLGKYNVDSNRVYLTGLSMGGYGSWSLGAKYPEHFAAIAPICGGGDTLPIILASRQKKAALSSMGVSAFHGGKDPVVALDESRRMTNALLRAGCKDVKLTIYPDAGHDSWTQAYNDPELWNWFLAHHR